jgi:NhaP-type Na+/H+ or K+/H+ antiporter
MSDIFSWPPEPYISALVGIGVLIALVAWLPLALKRLPLSLPIVCIAIGAALGHYAPTPVVPLPSAHPVFVEHFTELVVIIALMGAGLKIDRVFGWKRWAVTWRLLGPTMLLTIAGVTLIGVWVLGLPLPLAILLGGAMAPTDPVLAADVQVGPPKSGEDDEVRFGLTSEAGLNDGLAFPFVNLAIALAAASMTGEAWATKWVLHSVIWEIVAGRPIVRMDHVPHSGREQAGADRRRRDRDRGDADHLRTLRDGAKLRLPRRLCCRHGHSACASQP